MSIFSRFVIFIPLEDYLLFTFAKTLKSKSFHLQTLKANLIFRLISKNIMDEQFETAIMEIPLKKLMRNCRKLDYVIITARIDLKHKVIS